MNHKTLSILLAASMCLPAPPAVAFAQEGEWVPSIMAVASAENMMRASAREEETDSASDYKYTVSEDTVTITGLADDTTKTALVIPKTIEGKSVTAIDSGAFAGNTNLKSVKIPDSVKTIGDKAFLGCSGLTGIHFAGSEISFSDSAFGSCDALKTIQYGGTIAQWKELESPNSSEHFWCAEIQCSDGNYVNWGKVLGWISDGENVTIVNLKDKTKTKVVIPETTEEGSVIAIGSNAFKDCTELEDITIPGSVETIGNNAFYSCSALENIILPEGVKKIEGYAFWNCAKLKSISIPKSVTSIGDGIFFGCSALTTITYGGTKADWASLQTAIGTNNDILLSSAITCTDGTYTDLEKAFTYTTDTEIGNITITGLKNKNITALEIPAEIDGKKVTAIGQDAFSGCTGLESVKIPANITSVGAGAFYSCINLKSATIAEGVKEIGTAAFEGCSSLKSAVILGDVKAISNNMFHLCSKLTDVTLPESVETIGDDAFAGCSSLPSIILPKKVTKIGEDAFKSCDNLKMVYFCGTQAEWDAIAMDTGNGNLTAAKVICDFDGKLTVTFDANGGTLDGGNTFRVTCNEPCKEQPAPPIRTGYTFAGWYYQDAEWNWDTPIIDNITLTAKWTQNPTSNGGGSSSGGGNNNSSGGSAANKPTTITTTTNTDGSITTTTTDKNGTVTEKTEHTDGTVKIIETQKDGTVIKKTEHTDGAVETVETKPDGTTTTTRIESDSTTTTEVETADGTTTMTRTELDGTIRIEASLSKDGISAAAEKKEKLRLPISPVSVKESSSAPRITITVPAGEKARVEIPVENMNAGTVLVMLLPDGTEKVLPKAALGEDGISFTAEGDMTFKIVDKTLTFGDVKQGDWFADAATFASAHELFKGINKSEFAPNAPMSRGMLAVVLYALEGKPEGSVPADFNDVGDSWYTEAIGWAAEKGYISGNGDGTFGANENITREQMATILHNYMGKPEATGFIKGFTDSENTSGYAKDAMNWVTEKGIINGMGDGTLRPKGEVTRAQAATVMMNLVNLDGK